MADRIVKFAVLAEATVAEDLDKGVIFSLLGKHFPWWLPDPSTYMPWHHRPKSDPHDTGIVICTGSWTKVYAIHLIRILRDVLHSKLPIEIAYGGDEDLSFADRYDFMTLGHDIRLINLVDHFDERVGSLRNGGFAMKPFSMLASRFRKVIMVDADTVFLRAPDRVFVTEPGLVETGTLFWHDRAVRAGTVDRHRWIESFLREQEASPALSQTAFWTDKLSEQQDSAVVCIDKGRPRVFTSLLFSVWMNLKNVRDEVTYKHLYGDKETFWLAAELTQTPYFFNPWYASCLGTLKTNNTVCGSQAGQRDHHGNLFWYNGAIRHNKWGHGRELVNMTHWMGGKQHSGKVDEWWVDGEDAGPTADMWCLCGDNPIPVVSLGEVWSIMQKMLKVAEEVDDRYYQ
ncbi:hypothetical protein MMC29_000807 [Sticta canariensis]|nr:hypothetical protein [Sticta canariensis]